MRDDGRSRERGGESGRERLAQGDERHRLRTAHRDRAPNATAVGRAARKGGTLTSRVVVRDRVLTLGFQVEIEADFFHCGGNSLLAGTLHRSVRAEHLAMSLCGADIAFEGPRALSCAGQVDVRSADDSPDAGVSMLPLAVCLVSPDASYRDGCVPTLFFRPMIRSSHDGLTLFACRASCYALQAPKHRLDV
eukprot:630287-Rhodomonas_salina.2